jgi:hypothetical protein
MTVPTNNNFVAGDLDQLTGLKGDASTKYISTGTDYLDYAQDDTSISAYVSTPSSGWYAGTSDASTSVYIRDIGTTLRSAAYGGAFNTGTAIVDGLVGVSRSAATTVNIRSNQVDTANNSPSQSPAVGNLEIYGRNGAATSASRLATYHAGPALDLATLEGLQATLLSEVAAAKAFIAAASYFSRLVAAGDTTHVAYKQPLTNYITSLVGLGGAYWDTMLSATSFVGVGIEGITVPLKDGMPAITNNNFVAADLNQLTGLKGDGSTKYLDTGTKFNDAPQNDFSMSVNATETILEGSGGYYLSWQSFGDGVSDILSLNDAGVSNNDLYTRNQNRTTNSIVDQGSVEDLAGINRTSSTGYLVQYGASSTTITETSQVPANQIISVFGSSANPKTDARLATYHIGRALDLPTLRGLQATLISEIAAI